jgi:hypothetical protein
MLSEEAAVANAEYIYYSSPYTHVKDNLDYQIYMGYCDYVYKLDENGEYILDENGEPIVMLDENGDPIIEYFDDGDYSVIYYEEFENSLGSMFASYAYKDLDTTEGANISTQDLNDYWEGLKVDSGSFDGTIYIVCGVILVGIIAFAVYSIVINRKRRKLYWSNTPSIAPQNTVEKDDSMSETVMIAAVKAENKKTTK